MWLLGLQFAADPEAYGVSAQVSPLARTLSVRSSEESDTSDSSSGSSEVVQYPCRLSQRRPNKVKSKRPGKKVQSVVVPILAAGAAVLVARHQRRRVKC